MLVTLQIPLPIELTIYCAVGNNTGSSTNSLHSSTSVWLAVPVCG